MQGDIRPLHIGKFVPPPYAGVENHVDSLLRALLPEVGATLVAGQSPTGSREELPYRVLAARSFGKLASTTMSPGVIALARRELTSGRCNVLHIHAPNPWGDLAALMCPREVPIVMTWHSDIVRQRTAMLLYRYVQRAVLKRTDQIVVFTPFHYSSSRQLLPRLTDAKVKVIPIGIDASHLHALPDDPATATMIAGQAKGRRVVLTVGRHVPYKGYEHLLAAFAALREDALLVMIGAGPLSASLAALADRLGIAERTMFLGEVGNRELATAYRKCDVFCLPSVEQSEAFGMASAEAMSFGKPTIVCELGNGVNFLNQANLTGLTVPPREPLALASAIDHLLSDHALRKRLGEAAKEWVTSQFSVTAMKRETIAVYRSLLARVQASKVSHL